MTMPVADVWFTRDSVGDGVTLIREPRVDSLIRCNIWHVRGRDRDLLIDCGLGLSDIGGFFQRPLIAVATHAHFDHVGGLHEFDHRLAHRLEAAELAAPATASLFPRGLGEDFHGPLLEAGYVLDAPLLDAVPELGFDPSAYAVRPAPATGYLDDGDVVDLGDRCFQVLHLPGHSPGGIGLWEAATGILFSGDAVYDGTLFDFLSDSNVADYIRTMRRLRNLPVRVVHGGHNRSMDRARMIEVIDAYLNSRTL
jgi:glyoxylase-like metal-dependent hydrolase (beta-lactamase superfamily II)